MGLDVAIVIRGDITSKMIERLNERIDRAGILTNKWNEADYPNRFAPPIGGVSTFNTMWRYWKPTYERGPWPLIAAVLRLASSLPGVSVYYGSDCDRDLELWTPEREREFWEHFAGPDGDLYYQ